MIFVILVGYCILMILILFDIGDIGDIDIVLNLILVHIGDIDIG